MSTGTPSGAPSGAPSESPEEKKLENAIKIICDVAQKGEKSGFAVDTVAEAAYFFRTSVLTAPFRAAWDVLPAWGQREFAAANQTTAGKFLMDYLPMLNLRFYFTPGLLVAGLAECGIVQFKLNEEEESTMEAEIGADATEEAKVAYRSKVEEQVIQGITMPFEGAMGAVAGKGGAVLGTVVPEAKPLVIVAKGANVLNEAKNGYFVQVRERVHALELEAAKAAAEAKKVPDTAVDEHNQVAKADPEAHIEPIHPEESNVIPFDGARNVHHFEQGVVYPDTEAAANNSDHLGHKAA